MVKSSKGFRSRSRGVFTKEVRDRGMPPPTHFLREYQIGDRVSVRLEASDPHGQPHPRYQGRTCVDGGKAKELIATPVHLIPATPSRDPEA